MVTEAGWCVQLSLVPEVWNDQTGEYGRTADAPRVLCLWTMSKEKRVLLWNSIQPQLRLQDLSLGGGRRWNGIPCPVEDEELATLCPKGSLYELQQLFLHTSHVVSDCGLSALASAGCGAQLTSLTLDSE